MKKFLTVLVFLMIVILVQALGSFLTDLTLHTWYHSLKLPSFILADDAFAPVWVLLYFLLAIIGGILWFHRKTANGRIALILWVVQLVGNALWTFFFFSLKNVFLGGIDIILIFILTLLSMVYALRSPATLAGWLYIPYLIWIAYAAVLNWAIYALN